MRRWYELGSYTKLKPTYREALVRQRGAYKPGDSGRRGVLVDHPVVQQQIIQILQDLRGAGVPLNVSIARVRGGGRWFGARHARRKWRWSRWRSPSRAFAARSAAASWADAEGRGMGGG